MIKPEDVTVGMFSRERYSLTPLAIDNLRSATPDGVRFTYVDGAVPDVYREPVEDSLRRFGEHTIIASNSYVLPIEATNRLIEACKTPVLALVQNDVFVEDNWLEPVIDALNDDPDLDYVSPEIMEAHQVPITPDSRRVYHFNPSTSTIEDLPEGGHRSVVERRPKRGSTFQHHVPRLISHLEEHAFFGRTDSFRTIAPFPNFLNTREQIDMAMRMHYANQRILFEPRSRVTYAETRLEPPEIPHYLLRWDAERAERSNAFVQVTHGLQDYKSSMRDVNIRIRNAKNYKTI